MDPPKLIIRNHHEEGEDRLLERKEIVVSWFPLDGGEGVVRLFKDERDFRRRHFI